MEWKVNTPKAYRWYISYQVNYKKMVTCNNISHPFPCYEVIGFISHAKIPATMNLYTANKLSIQHFEKVKKSPKYENIVGDFSLAVISWSVDK